MSALTLLLAVATAPGSEAKPETAQTRAWKPGDGWHVRMVSSPREEAESRYDMHVILTATEKIDQFDCWRLDFIPVGKTHTLGAGYRLWFDKADGTPRRMWLRNAPRKTAEAKLPLTEGLTLSSSPPPGFPIEVLPLLGDSSLRSKDGEATLQLSSQREKGYVWRQATLSKGGKEQLIVKQKWVDGEPWWSEYERWRDGWKELSGTLVPKKLPPTAPVSPTPPSSSRLAKAVPSAAVDAKLRADPRLQAQVSLTLQDPSVEAILAPLREATGVSLTVQEDTIAQDRPAFTAISVRGVPAWMVLFQLADSESVRGRWEPSADGYHLVGTRSQAVREGRSPAWSPGPLLIAANVIILLFLIGVSVWRWRRAKH